jgi:hypothetical protein
VLTRAKKSVIGATDGNIMAAIIVTQMPRYQPRPPRSVPGPSSIPRIRATETIHATSAPVRSAVATTIASTGDEGRSETARPPTKRDDNASGREVLAPESEVSPR